jgi:cytochrome c
MKKRKIAFAVAAVVALASAPPARAAFDDAKAADVMKTAGCAACHTVDKKLVGPAYKDVAAKRKGEADAVTTLMGAVRAGSKGTYGQIPMPPSPEAKISDADLRSLIEWLLTK